MHSETPTKLDLYTWAKIIGINPLHFAGIDVVLEGQGAHCTQPWVQYEWQGGDRTGREAVARAIAMAEANMEQYLKFRLLPSWEVGEQHEATQLWNPGLRGFWPSRQYQTDWGYIVTPGSRATTILDNDSAITWSVNSYWQIGTVTAAVPAGTLPCEVRIFFPGRGPDPTWEIRPADVSITGTTATITFRRECAVDPDLWDALEFVAADGEDDSDFIAEVDVWRIYTDTSGGLAYRWYPYGLCGCNGDGCEACTIQTQSGCLYIRDADIGVMIGRPGSWTDGAFTIGEWSHFRPADQVQLAYFAGYRDQRLTTPKCDIKTMDGELARAVAYYAAALLERPPCDCQVDSWYYWREDVNSGEGVRYSVQAVKQNPLGTRRGAIYAWDRVMERTLGASVLVR